MSRRVRGRPQTRLMVPFPHRVRRCGTGSSGPGGPRQGPVGSVLQQSLSSSVDPTPAPAVRRTSPPSRPSPSPKPLSSSDPHLVRECGTGESVVVSLGLALEPVATSGVVPGSPRTCPVHGIPRVGGGAHRLRNRSFDSLRRPPEVVTPHPLFCDRRFRDCRGRYGVVPPRPNQALVPVPGWVKLPRLSVDGSSLDRTPKPEETWEVPSGHGTGA